MKLAHLIFYLSVISQSLKAVGKQSRNEKGTSIFHAQLDCQMMTVSNRLRTQIYHDIMNRAAHTADKLRLTRWRLLVMHASQCARLEIGREIALNNSRVEPVLRELSGAEGAREEAALVLVWLEINNKHAAEGSFSKFHGAMRVPVTCLAAVIPPEKAPVDLLCAQKILKLF